MRRTFRCSSSRSRACALSRNTPISGSFLGQGASPSNSELYHRRLRPMLDADARAYWDKRNVVGRPRHAYFTDGF